MSKKAKIVIVGAGFGGIEFVKALHRKPVEVLLVDRNNYHNFQPLMYQVATGGLEPSSIAYPVRRIFIDYKNFSFRMAEVTEVDIAKNKVLTSIGTIDYDFLVIASGSENNFFNFESVKDELLPLKSVPDSLKLRNHIFRNLERAMASDQKDSVEKYMNIAIVGGGPAGLELAGALAEMKKYIIPREFPGLDLSKMSINIYESGSELLGNMSEEASVKSLEYLKALGVNVFLNTRVKSYDGSTIELNDGTHFITDSVIWSAGVRGSPIKGFPESTIVDGNRIAVNEFNQVLETENIFAIGDVAACITPEYPKGLPMLAPVAQRQGAFLAKNIVRKIENKPMEPFQYHNKGVMATIGRNKAVVDLPHYKFQGVFAWFIWMFVHILSLAGYRNKIITFIDWVINYFSYARPLGVILISAKAKESKQNREKREEEKV
ncbi:NAD(P)/FAD-dependent oxidoreductase [Chryseobacterium salivictor]|uniref:NADH:ubiquinone reductase (non-electrogenic) n=1 Tax=Chryseobacterium salivictor TaxID=2547600 RepID=A0A4P6ZCB6_9FLAO|nr:NAD(P)/FAD-dependent oxidoreductase [Chryseobacterium salivictor]QBO57045.1 NADH dehydrogenase-like protein [Chryseobacterium salivictor]